MNNTFEAIKALIKNGHVNISDHGYNELAEDGLFVRDIISSVDDAVIIEEYPDYPKGPCVLVLQIGDGDKPVHVVWGIPKGQISPAVLVTAYRPDPDRWETGYLRRKK